MAGSQTSQDRLLRERAAEVIPGGMYGHMSVAPLPEAFPQYFESGRGCRLIDVDGREYMDFMCGYGPILLGMGDPRVEAAVQAQLQRGSLFTGPGAVMVDLAEKLVETVAHADWAMFAKNGTDATTACATIARARTGRNKLLVAKRAYHGAAPWCSPSRAGITPEDRAQLIKFRYNDRESFDRAALEAGDDFAGVMVTPFRHDVFSDQELVDPAWAQHVRQVCSERGAALILDDVRAGFRLDVAGSWQTVGVEPDLSAFSKALGNGHPIAAVVGSEPFRQAASEVFLTGSFWFEAAPMAAALATLQAVTEPGFVAALEASGERLRAGLDQQAAAKGFTLGQTGPVQMPMVRFGGDDDLALANRFTSEAVQRGVYLHPFHNMFLSAAHTPAEIDWALERTEQAFAALADSRPA